MTNGETFADILKRGAESLMAEKAATKSDLIPVLYAKALGRQPAKQELELSRQMVGDTANSAGVEDLLWSLAMLPEFQLIY